MAKLPQRSPVPHLLGEIVNTIAETGEWPRLRKLEYVVTMHMIFSGFLLILFSVKVQNAFQLAHNKLIKEAVDFRH